MGHRSTDAVPLSSLVSEHAEVGVHHVIYHVIRRGHVKTITEPIDAHLSRGHGIEHEVLQILQGLRVGEKCFCHVDIIGTGQRRSRPLVCHLANWFREAADQFVLLSLVSVSDNETQQMHGNLDINRKTRCVYWWQIRFGPLHTQMLMNFHPIMHTNTSG